MKATGLLRDQHRRVERLLARIDRDREFRVSLVLELVREMMTHLAIEDRVFLHRVSLTTGLRADAYRQDQALVRNAVLQAVFAEDDDAAFAARLGELCAAFGQHVRGFEEDVFPLVDARVRGDVLESMGACMASSFDAALRGDPPRPPAHDHAAE
jgi:Hemerythrin HHE cation binding domain